MTPTNELRAKLDELGVAWWQRKCHTCWKVEKKQGTEHWRAWLAPDGTITLKVDAIYGFTPEQAVTATVGNGTCHVKAVKKLGDSFGFSLSCGHSMVNPFDDRPDYCPWCGAKVVVE